MSLIYVAQAPREGDADASLIADRWRWGAFAFPLLWALWGRHWLAAAALAACALALAAAVDAGLLALAGAAELGLRVAVGWEGGALARLDRRLRGWREVGALEAEDDAGAEVAWAQRIAARGPWGQPGAQPGARPA